MTVVRYEDPAMFNCGLPKAGDYPLHIRAHSGFCGPEDRFGWQGLVVDLEIDEEGTLFLLSDEGFAAAVTDTAEFTIV